MFLYAVLQHIFGAAARRAQRQRLLDRYDRALDEARGSEPLALDCIADLEEQRREVQSELDALSGCVPLQRYGYLVKRPSAVVVRADGCTYVCICLFQK